MLTIGDKFPSFDLAAVKGGPAGLNLKDAFTRITDAKLRRSIVDLVEQIAAREGPDKR